MFVEGINGSELLHDDNGHVLLGFDTGGVNVGGVWIEVLGELGDVDDECIVTTDN